MLTVCPASSALSSESFGKLLPRTVPWLSSTGATGRYGKFKLCIGQKRIKIVRRVMIALIGQARTFHCAKYTNQDCPHSRTRRGHRGVVDTSQRFIIHHAISTFCSEPRSGNRKRGMLGGACSSFTALTLGACACGLCCRRPFEKVLFIVVSSALTDFPQRTSATTVGSKGQPTSFTLCFQNPDAGVTDENQW